MSTATFTRPDGGDPAQYILTVAKDAMPTEGDALFAAQRQRSRILERTARGVDFIETAFEPYNETIPYTYYPSGRAARGMVPRKSGKGLKQGPEMKRAKLAVKRLLRKLGEIDSRAGAVGVDLGSSGGRATRNGQGIWFPSYADFKRSLGRLLPDLRGPRAPHMLQAIAVGANFERIVGDDQIIALRDRTAPAATLTVGIYGEEAGRATAHNEGVSPRWKGRHQRRFLDASETDLSEMAADIANRCLERIRSLI